jgi:periplasmic divalent cation tolerance protein
MHIVIFITAGSTQEAGKIAKTLVEERLAACVNMVDGVRSVYRWRQGIKEATEVLLIAKSTDEKLGDLTARVKQIHSYKTPEIVAIGVRAGSSEYLEWITSSVVQP